MTLLQTLFIALVALLHIYFLILEMFLWTKPKGLKTFGLKKEYAQQSKVLAANQGLYNGFLAAGLIWSIVEKNTETAIFFLICVTIAGVYGSYSTKKLSLLFIQTVPAIIAILLVIFNK